ncbi:hypothetical protein ACEN9F_19585 [Duganella sp. CT11-25]|jgi:predicted HTH domain antitoxin|uniref:hypothetical protein n=1 Tax=unclassified Duganella TaxID=2636909 RepID=UPI0039AEA295
MSSTLLEDEVKLAQAARYLNVTPRYLLHLLEQRRLTLDSLTMYKEERQKISQQALQKLVDQAQELNMGY